jgi:2-iminobutanoate/2-iminopropanoate deaminase
MGFIALAPEDVAPNPAPLSQVVVSGDLVFLAGQVPLDSDGRLVGDDIEAQARQVFTNMAACLRDAGCDFGDVVKVTAFLADLSEAPQFNAVYRAYFHEPYPVRTTVAAALPGFKLEVEAVARRPHV